MTTLSKYGVPVGDPNRRIIMPWAQHRFKVKTHAVSVTQNVTDVAIDYVAKTIKIKVRATVDPQHYLDALRFADRSFCIDAMDGTGDGHFFRLIPKGIRLQSHEFGLDYKTANYAVHDYTFTFEDMGVQAPEEKLEPTPPLIDDDGFVTPAEAMRSYEERMKDVKKGLTGDRQLLNEDDDHCPRDAGC